MRHGAMVCVVGALLSLTSVLHAEDRRATTINAEIGDVSWHARLNGGALDAASERERIQVHLAYVEAGLRKARPTLSAAQTIRRARLLDALSRYRQQGVFPQRGADAHEGRRPRFVDDAGVHCAVAHLLAASGESAMVKRVARAHEFSYVADIDDAGLRLWTRANGMTLLELAMIQPSYGPLPFRRTFSFDLYGGVAPFGVGPAGGLRLGLTLFRLGLYGRAWEDDQDQDVLRLVLGIDVYNARRRDGFGPGNDLALGVPIALAWETFGSSPFSWLVELGVNIYVHPGKLSGESTEFVDHWANWLNIGVGGVWRFTDHISVMARLGLPVSFLGLRVELGDTSFRPGP